MQILQVSRAVWAEVALSEVQMVRDESARSHMQRGGDWLRGYRPLARGARRRPAASEWGSRQGRVRCSLLLLRLSRKANQQPSKRTKAWPIRRCCSWCPRSALRSLAAIALTAVPHLASCLSAIPISTQLPVLGYSTRLLAVLPPATFAFPSLLPQIPAFTSGRIHPPDSLVGNTSVACTTTWLSGHPQTLMQHVHSSSSTA